MYTFRTDRRRAVLSAILLLVVTIASACAGAGAAGDATPSASATAAPELQDPLDCEVHGYPCSLADVPAEVLERSEGLGRDAAERLRGGDQIADVVASLEDEPEMASVDVDGTTVRFRLEGGRHVWIMDRPEQESTALRPDSGSLVPITPPPPTSPRRIDDRGESRMEPKLDGVVGEAGAPKTAIVIAPYAYEEKGGRRSSPRSCRPPAGMKARSTTSKRPRSPTRP